MSVLVKIEGLQPLIDGYLRSTVSREKSLDELKRAILKGFEEDDKRRGTPYLEPTRKVSNNYRIEYKDPVVLTEGEEVVPPGGIADLGIDFGDGSEDEDTSVNEGYYEDSTEEYETVDPSEYLATLATRDISDDNDVSVEDAVVVVEPQSLPAIDVDPASDGFDDWVTYYQPQGTDEDSDYYDVSLGDYEVEDSGSEPAAVDDEITPDTSIAVDAALSSPVEDHGTGNTDIGGNTSSVRSSESLPPRVAPSRPSRPSRPGRPNRPSRPGRPSRPSRPSKPSKASGESRSSGPSKAKSKTVESSPLPKSREYTRAEAMKDAFEEFDSLFGSSGPAKAAPSKIERPSTAVKATGTGYRSLRDLVKNNPGCTVEFASRYFTRREIKKAVSLGNVFVKNGKLSV